MKKRLFIVLFFVLFTVSCLFACNGNDVGETSTSDVSASQSDASIIDVSSDEGDSHSSADLTVFSITYDLDGGVADNPTTYTEEDEIILRNPVKSGFSFIGWTYDGVTDPVMNVKIGKGTTGDKSFVAHYIVYNFEPLKVAIFADVQLTSDKNQASTANAYLALKYHFKYAKSIGADVLFMSGDILNNAVETYYQLYEKALKEVYGDDESEYPEFVMNMGNHEWWDEHENEVSYSVTMFKKYARIESPNLVRQSAVPYYLNADETLPSYYKVIKGVPFLAVSADKSNGEIGEALKAEIAEWLREIAELESVKNGGPIFVSYHYPIPEVTYKGEHAEPVCGTIDELLKDYPSAIVFTGDTHYNGVNERTINQVDYTSINIGTSSYSRAVSESATGFKYDNVNKGTGKSSAGTMKGDVAFKFEYTPTIMIAEINSSDTMTIDRFFTADDVADVKKIGKTWEFPNVKSKDDFIYTDERIESKEWANWLYGKDALLWGDGETVKFNVQGDNMIVNFKDVIDYNCAEHYRIEVKDGADENNVKYYDFMGPYYKYDDEAHDYNYVLEDIPTAANYKVTVTAYDFFDNASANVLTANSVDVDLGFPEMIDVKTIDTYSDISRRVNYEVTADGSSSSVEYYYKGTKKYPAGMLLNRLISTGTTVHVKDYLSIEDWSEAVLKFKVKNVNDFDIYFSLTLVIDQNGAEKWITDGGLEYRVTVPANSDWTTVKWNFAKQFNITSDIIKQLALKVAVPNSVVDEENGYELAFFIDDLDVTDKEEAIPHEYAFNNSLTDNITKLDLFSATTSDKIEFSYKLKSLKAEDESDSRFSFMIFDGIHWGDYINYIVINTYTNTSTNPAVSITEEEDGWYNVVIDLSLASVNGSQEVMDSYTLTSIFMRPDMQTCSVLLDGFKKITI